MKKSASIQPQTSSLKFARSQCTDPPGAKLRSQTRKSFVQPREHPHLSIEKSGKLILSYYKVFVGSLRQVPPWMKPQRKSNQAAAMSSVAESCAAFAPAETEVSRS